MRVKKQDRLIGLFPPISSEVRRWCLTELFPSYIFMSKKIKGKRTAVCDECGAEFDGTNGRHKEETVCPVCGKRSLWWHERYKHNIFLKEKLYIPYRTDEYNLHRWCKVYFSYDGDRRRVQFVDYWYSGINHNTGEKFAYGEVHALYKPNYIGRKRYDCPSRSYMYRVYPDEVVDDIFGIEIAKYIRADKKYDIFELAKRLQEYPQTEYLLKSGMVHLAHWMDIQDVNVKKFDELLGIEKQYIPIASKYDIHTWELELIREYTKMEYMSEEIFEMCRRKEIAGYELIQIRNTFPGITIGRAVRYIAKQFGHALHVLNTYHDYIRMAEELNIPLTKKYDIYPKDLRAEHDRLAEKIKIKKDKKKTAEFIQKVKAVYSTIPAEYKNDKFTVVLPQTPADFGTEGQNLKICVGSGWYIDRQYKGQSMVFFIRKTDAPEQSFVCCEIDLETYKICQIHGYKNDIGKPLPAGTRKFAEEYLEEIKKFRKKAV